MRKLVLDLSVAQILPEKINKMFLPKRLGFIDVLSTAHVEVPNLCKNLRLFLISTPVSMRSEHLHGTLVDI